MTAKTGAYALATGAEAVRRLHVLHNIYSPAARRVLLQAGVKKGMRVADFGCGVGATTRMLSEMVGPSGSVTGVDVDKAQLEQAAAWCTRGELTNVSFVEANASSTNLPRNAFDLVYCRYLLLHLTDPVSCLREMRDVLKPGGILFVEDGDLASASSLPPSSLHAFADLFSRLGPVRGVDYSLANHLYHLVKSVGFSHPKLEIHQPALLEDEDRYFLQWSVAEAGPAFVDAGLITSDQLEQTLSDMQDATEDRDVLILAPRMFLVWALKA
jgi:ubiquinone/menaquinone biosynthesis C-methylase UbiE